MSAADLQKVMEQIVKLSPEERLQLERFLAAAPAGGREDALAGKLRELGLVRHPPRSRSGTNRTRKELIRVSGKPVSETLIEERR